jgi:hypothetical protein
VKHASPNRPWKEQSDELDAAFEQGAVESAPDEQLRRWLLFLGKSFQNTSTAHPRDVVRGITLNNIQMTRFLARESRRNTWLAIIVGIIALFSLAASTIQAIAAWHTLHASPPAAQSISPQPSQ